MDQTDKSLAEIDALLEEKYSACAGYRELAAGLVNVEKLDLASVLTYIDTSAYCGLDCKRLVEQFVWLCGADEELHASYFSAGVVRDDIPRILHDALIACGYAGMCSNSLLSIRFRSGDMLGAIRAGNTRLVRFWHRFGVELNATYFEAACGVGKLETILYMIERGLGNTSGVKHAARGGHVDVMRFLVENKFPYDSSTYTAAVTGGNVECLKYLDSINCEQRTYMIEVALQHARINCVDYLLSKGYAMPKRGCHLAAMSNNIDCMKYAIDKKCKLDGEVFDLAMYTDNLALIQCVCEAGCPKNYRACEYAARCGKVDILRYLHSVGLAITLEVYREAIGRYGSVECLRYLDEKKCPRPGDACTLAIRARRVDMLEYFHTTGCVLNDKLYSVAVWENSELCIKYIGKNLPSRR